MSSGSKTYATWMYSPSEVCPRTRYLSPPARWGYGRRALQTTYSASAGSSPCWAMCSVFQSFQRNSYRTQLKYILIWARPPGHNVGSDPARGSAAVEEAFAGASPVSRLGLPYDPLHHVAVHVRQAEVAAGVAVGELLVVEAEEVQDRRVEVVDRDLPLDGLVPIVIRGAVAMAALHAASGHPHGEGLVVVVA